MIDKKRLTIIAVVIAVLIAVIVALIVALMNANRDSAATPPSPTGEPVVPTVVETDPTPEIVFTEEQLQTIRDVAAAATTWTNITTNEANVQRYIDAGMSSSLAREFVPVWAEIYLGGAEIYGTLAPRGTPTVVDYTPGSTEGTGIFQVEGVIDFDGTARLEPGRPVPVTGQAIWLFALDEATGKVIAIAQPTLAELNVPLEQEEETP